MNEMDYKTLSETLGDVIDEMEKQLSMQRVTPAEEQGMEAIREFIDIAPGEVSAIRGDDEKKKSHLWYSATEHLVGSHIPTLIVVQGRSKTEFAMELLAHHAGLSAEKVASATLSDCEWADLSTSLQWLNERMANCVITETDTVPYWKLKRLLAGCMDQHPDTLLVLLDGFSRMEDPFITFGFTDWVEQAGLRVFYKETAAQVTQCQMDFGLETELYCSKGSEEDNSCTFRRKTEDGNYSVGVRYL